MCVGNFTHKGIMTKRIIKKESVTDDDKLNDLLNHTYPDGDCMIWKGCLNTDGYARMAGNVKVHRLVVSLKTKEDITGYVVRHTCDNPKCINPEHLVKGTVLENVLDRDTRGRTYRKITVDTIRKVLVLLDSNLFSQKEIANIVGIDPRRVSDISLNKYCSATRKFLGRG